MIASAILRAFWMLICNWDEESKFLLLEVQLINKARKAWNRLPEESKGNQGSSP